MKFLRDLFINFCFLIAVFLVLYLIYPDLVRGMYQMGLGMFGPWLLLLFLLVVALPRGRRR